MTRSLAVVPAIAVVLWRGGNDLTGLMVASQVVLSFQLPFAMVPLVQFVGSRRLMGEFTLAGARKLAVWAVVLLVLGFNLLLLARTAGILPG